MSQIHLEFDQDRFWLLMSALQKRIRRGESTEAMVLACELCLKAPSVLWSRLKIIATEDVGQPLEIVAVDTLARQFKELEKEGDEDGGKWGNRVRLAMTAAKILADARKDRRQDEMLHVLSYAHEGNAASKELLSKYQAIPDVAFDMHTGQGKKRGRGYRHFVQEGSAVTNPTPEHEEWHALWIEVMKDAPHRDTEKQIGEAIRRAFIQLSGRS